VNVKLLKHTPNPEKTIALAARLCYSQIGVKQLSKKITKKDIENFIEMLKKVEDYVLIKYIFKLKH
jgi:thymidylate synthase (FAD)